jgi:hypothetical protein
MRAATFQLEADEYARAWLAAHRSADSWVVAYGVHRCCGGGQICRVSVRELAPGDRTGDYAVATLPDGTRFAIDPRAARRLPAHFRLTLRGFGPLKHLDLDLDGEQWGEPLYT